MFETEDELLEKIQLGEDSLIELKRVVFRGRRVTGPERSDLSDEIAGFANAKGGVLVLGVDDKTRDIDGIPLDKLDLVVDFVREICQDTIKPSLSVDIERLRLPNIAGEMLPVLRVDVPKSLWIHKSAHGYFRRQVDSAKEIPPDQLSRLFQERSQARIIRFEEQIVPETTMDDLDDSLSKRFTSPDEEDPASALRKLRLIGSDDEGQLRATVAGVLFASTDPRKYLPNAFIQAVRYRGTVQDSNYQVSAQDISGPLDRQILDAMAFFRLNQRVAATKDLGRTDWPQFSERAVFEAIVNAVAHRDYSIHYAKIRFFIFDDRLEIYSPGALVNSMTVDVLSFRTGTRNELITNLLSRCRAPESSGELPGRALMEKRGDGVKAIFRESEKHSGKKPIYEVIGDEELLLTIFSADLPNQGDKETNDV